MKELFYYVRGPRGVHGESKSKQLHTPGTPVIAPVVTVCLIKTADEKYVRGISICSLKETPCKKTGRLHASRNARLAAYERQSSGRVLRDVAFKAMAPVWEKIREYNTTDADCDEPMVKAAFDVRPTVFESRLIAGMNLEAVYAYRDENYDIRLIPATTVMFLESKLQFVIQSIESA